MNESIGDYRYGFQGQEMDNEIKGEGNSVNYKYRMHDPRVGRFFATDPLSFKCPFYSPYSFSGNRVIDATELEGLEPLRTPEEEVNKSYKPKFIIALPDGTSATIYAGSPHGPPFAISRTDIDRIRSFPDQGYSVAESRNTVDNHSASLNGGEFVFVAGRDGVSQPDDVGIRWADVHITGPTSIVQNVNTPGSQNFNFNMRVTSGEANIPFTNNTNFTGFGTARGNTINNNINAVQNNAPANAIRTITSVNQQINSNLSAAQQQTLRNEISASTNVPVNFVVTDLGNTTAAGAFSVNYTDTTQQQVQTVQEIED